MNKAQILARAVAGLALAVGLGGCAGSHVLSKEKGVELDQPLAVAGDGTVSVSLDWVVVKDGPGTWASNAFWDEYRLRVGNHSGSTVSVVQVQVVDSMNVTQVPGDDRKELLYASKLAEDRYARRSLSIHPGAGTGGMVAASVVGGVAAATAVGYAGILTTANAVGLSGSAAASAPLMTTMAYATPLLIVGGIVHHSNNAEVSDEIGKRRSELPVIVEPGEIREVRAFFPIAPSPRAVRVIYKQDDQAALVELDTSEVLDGLHIADPNAPSRRPQEGEL